MSKILVTGGAGFLGSNLIKSLLEDGHEVICVDTMESGMESNIAPFRENPNFTFLQQDILDPLDVEVDEIYNLACLASPPFYQKRAIYTLKTSFIGVLNLLELARKTGAKFFHASTSEVYGDPLEHPQSENYYGNVNSFGPRSCYDEGKRAAEALIYEYKRNHGVDVRVVRIFNVYGPGMNPKDGRVVTNFIINALQNKPLPVFDDGQQTRSFCYVDDEIKGFRKLMDSDVDTPVNIGNPGEFTILELAGKILNLTGSTAGIEHIYPKEDSAYHKKADPAKRRPNIEKAKTLLGWEPTISLDEGLRPTIEYYRELLNL